MFWTEPQHNSLWHNNRYHLNSYGAPVENKLCILHPDTMLPIDVSKLEANGPLERIDGAWSLGITLSTDGVVRSIGDGTPASRSRIVFESKVTEYSIDLFLRSLSFFVS